MPHMKPMQSLMLPETQIYTHCILLTYVLICTYDIAHLCPTGLLLERPHITDHANPIKQQSATGVPPIIARYVPETICPEYQLLHVTHETTMPVYVPHMNSLQLSVYPEALIYIHFTLLKICPEQNNPTTLTIYVPLYFF